MTTIIIVIIAVAVLVVLGSKMFSSGSSGSSRQGEMAPGPGEPSPKKEKKAKSPVEKTLKISPDMDVSGAALFRPPPETTLFTGRKEILKDIASKATTRPIMVGLSGFSGVGKTSLTIPLSAMFASQYPGVCLFIDMQGNHPDPPSGEDIMRRIILKFHPTQPLPTDEKKLTKLYRVALKKHKGILILDNVSGIQQVNPLIPPSSWLLIVTSTKPIIMPKMIAIALQPMEILEAHTLLTRWAPEISPAIKEISLICQGIPLALEITGKLFAINSTMAPDYFAKKFKEAQESIGGGGETSNLIDGVRATLTLSYNMLPEKTAQVFRKLYVFPESFTASAASFICEDPKGLSLTGLEKFGLIQHNVNTNRFSLHPQIRKFIKPLLKSADRAMAEKRLATEFMNVLETAYHHIKKGGKDAVKGFRLFDLELENIKAGMEWGRKHCAQDKDAARVCSAYVENGATMIGQRLSPAECIQWFEAALSAAKLLEDKEAEGQHLLNLGQQYVLLNRSQEAMDTLQRALAFCKKEGDIEGQRTALQQLVLICLKNNNYSFATEHMEEDLELVRASGDEEEEFKLLVQLTKFCTQNKEYNKAVHTGEKAIELATINDDKPLEITLLLSLGKGYAEIGEAKKALEKLEMGLELSERTKGSPLQLELITQVGNAALKAGDIPGALKHLVKGLETVRKANNPSTEGSLLIQLGEVHMHNQDEDQATKYLEEAQGLSQKIKDRLMEGRTLWVWSQALGKAGNLAGAVSRGQEALKIYEELKKIEAKDIRTQIENWSKD